MLATDTSAITHNVDKESCNLTTVNQVTGITYPVAVVIGTVSCGSGILVFLWVLLELVPEFF